MEERTRQAAPQEVLVDDVVAQRRRGLVRDDVVPAAGPLPRLVDLSHADRAPDPPAAPQPPDPAETPAVHADLELEPERRARNRIPRTHAAGGVVDVDQLRLALERAVIVEVQEGFRPPRPHPGEPPLLTVPRQDLLEE